MAKIPQYAIKAIEQGRTYITNMDSPTYKVGGIKKFWKVTETMELPGNEWQYTVEDNKNRTYSLEVIKIKDHIKVEFQYAKKQEQKMNAWFDELEQGINF